MATAARSRIVKVKIIKYEVQMATAARSRTPRQVGKSRGSIKDKVKSNKYKWVESRGSIKYKL